MWLKDFHGVPAFWFSACGLWVVGFDLGFVFLLVFKALKSVLHFEMHVFIHLHKHFKLVRLVIKHSVQFAFLLME